VNPAPPLILAAEDEETDAFILRLAFEEAKVTNPLVVVSDGQDIVDYLTGTGAYGDRAAHPLPGLITLDLKMPRMNAFDVLAWLKAHGEFAALPTVVISSSSDDKDIAKARSLGAQDYFVKPHQLADFIAIVRSLQKRWLNPAAT
jgi:CheY-like chemotaxis protein